MANANLTEALRLTTDFDILLVQPGVQFPATMYQLGVPFWWEYELGKYAYDATGNWADSPVQPVPIVIPEPPPAQPTTTQPEPPVNVTIPKRWTISLFGGIIKERLRLLKNSIKGVKMKKLFALLLALVMLVSIFSDVSAGGDKVSGDKGAGDVNQHQVMDPPPFQP